MSRVPVRRLILLAALLPAFAFQAFAEPIASEIVEDEPRAARTDELAPLEGGVTLESQYFLQPYTIVIRPPGTVVEGTLDDAFGDAGLPPEGKADPSPAFHESALPKKVRVGIQKSTIQLSSVRRTTLVARTIDAIRGLFGDGNAEIHFLSRGELADAVKNGTVDFVVGEADFVAQFTVSRKLRPIASAWPSEARGVNTAASAVFFTNAESLDIQSLDQIGSVPVAALSPESFSGYLVPLYDLSKSGFVNGYLQRLYFTNGSIEAVIEDVLSGRASVGLLPACVLETCEKQGKCRLEDFRVINPKSETDLRCRHSTDVFPSIVVASTAQSDRGVEKSLAAALYGIPLDEFAGEWSLPASLDGILDVFYRLRIGPYQYLSQWSFQRFVKENTGFFTVAGILLLGVLFYLVMLQRTVWRRTRALERAIEERDEIEKEIADSRDRIAALERVSIIGQMSSMIAHELKQPLGAINNFGNGLIRRLRHGRADPVVLEETLREIVGQGTRAAEIVDKVRSYAKHPAPVMYVRDMREVLEKSIREFRHIYPSAPPVELFCYPLSWAEVDYLEMQLAVINLLKNATEALQGCSNPQIKVLFESADGEHEKLWRLSVEDNGREITQEKADLFFEPLNSGKNSGMGLGLSIVADIAERHKGHLRAGPNGKVGHGCVMTIFLPKPDASPVMGL